MGEFTNVLSLSLWTSNSCSSFLDAFQHNANVNSAIGTGWTTVAVVGGFQLQNAPNPVLTDIVFGSIQLTIPFDHEQNDELKSNVSSSFAIPLAAAQDALFYIN